MDARNQTASPGPGGSNVSPSTYQVNVNRKKTRKWVEAKVQNYDGDDWGAPESDQEDSPVAAPPPVPRPTGGPRLPSESRVASGKRAISGHAPVSVPTAQPPIEESVPAVTGPSNLTNPSDSIMSPQSGGPASGQVEPVLLPSSTYEQQPKQDIIAPPPPNVESTGEFEDESKRLSVSPQLPNVARMSGFGVDFFTAGGDPSNNRQPTVHEEREPSPQPLAKQPFPTPAVMEPETTAVESDLPSTTFTPPPAQPPTVEPEKTETHDVPQPAQPVPRRPSLPGQYVTEDPTHEMPPTPLSPPLQVNEPEISPVFEHAPKGAAASSVSDVDSQRLQSGADAKSLPPLRTPSPHEPRTVPPAVEVAAPAAIQSASSEHAKPDITPTEPLQPKSATYTPSDYEPQPLSRQFTVDTMASSPVKESDMLSEEIMRTLTPGGLTSPTDNPDEKRKSQAFPTGRESSYTLSGYDDYWADTADKGKSAGGLGDVPEVPPVPIIVPTETKSAEPAPLSPEPLRSPTSDSQASLRRRFSWEAPDAAAAATARAAPQPPVVATDVAKPEESEKTTPAGPTSPASPTIKVVSDAPSISHQVSQASSKPPTQPTPEPPSPVSELSDRDATPLAQPVVSPEDAGGLPMASPLSSNPVSGSHGDVQTPQILSPTPMSSGKPIMAFRDIMDIPTPKDRIAKYEETRSEFASQDSGLDNWITTMKSEYPEHANANGSFSGAPVSAPPSSAGGVTSAAQQPPPTDQPYYQQYLQANANAPSASNTGSTRSRMAGYGTQAQGLAGSAFGDGGKQIGTKGKEFMHTAGKMGKGLFSKGKSKLQQAREAREARGDKGETSPPPVDRRPQRPERPERPDRRMSWALSLGQKSRENGPAPPEATAGYNNGHGHGHERHDSSLSGVSVEPPRLAEPARMSPFLSNPSPTNGGQGVFWQDPDVNTSAAGHNGQDTEREAVTGIPAGPGSQAQRIEPPPNEDSDWVMVPAPRQSADLQDTVATRTDQNAHHPPKQLKATNGVVPDYSGIGIGMASQSPDTRPDAQRHSSFRGLPPIRRNSSFGLSAFDATADPGRVSPVEDDEIPTHDANGTSSSAIPYQQQYANGTLPPQENATNQSMGGDSNATLIGQDSTTRTGRSSMSLSKEPMRFYQPPQQQQQPLQVDTQMQGQTQQGQPGHPDAVNPIQRTPPSGWQLEESHLAAPLHVARKRAGTDNSQHQVAYGYEKETGASMSMSPSSPGAGPAQAPLPQHPRQRSSDVPPSSARRYPDLFRPAAQQQQQQQQQRERANSGGQQMAGVQQYQPRPSQEGQPPVDIAQEASHGASQEQPEDQGKRKASDIFKGIGGRFKKPNSEERRNSVNSAGFERTDTMNSMNSQGQTSLKKKRTSFLPGALRPRASMDVTPPPQINDPNRPLTQESGVGPERSGTPQSEKKRSLLGGRFSAAQQKFLPGGLPGSQRGSSTSVAANDTNSVGGAESVNSMGPPKKRFSGFTDKAATFSGRFRRSGDDQKQEANTPQDPASMSQSSLPPPPPPKSRGRSASAASAGSHSMAPPPVPSADSQDHRGRRGSFQGMMSNMMGRSSSKTRQEQTQQPHPQGQFVHHHPAAPSQQMYGGQGPYPPIQGQMSPPAQYPHQPPPQGDQGRGPSMDAGQRAARHMSGQSMQPPRPSPLAQESSAAGPQSPVHREDNRVVSPTPPSNHSERATSPSVEPSEGRVSPMPFAIARKPTKSGPHASTAGSQPLETVSSPTHSVATEQPAQSVASEHYVDAQPIEEPSRSSTPRNEPPSSPVKRQPTPHATALFASMLASEGPQPPVPSVPQEQSHAHTAQSSPQDVRSAAPSGHVRTESAASSRFAQSSTGFAPSREATPVQSAGPQGPPSAGRLSGSLQGSPAQTQQPEGRFSPQPAPGPQFSPQPTQGAQFQNPQQQQQQQQFPLQFMQHRPQGSPQNPQQGFYQQQQGPRPGPPQGPQPGAPQGQQGFNQPQGPLPQSPPQGSPGPQQGFAQQQGPRPQGPPQGPPGPQQGFQQNGPPQAQAPTAQPQGQESKLKGWKNRMSTQMTQMKSQPQPRQEGQQVHQVQQVQQVQQGQQPTKESWKDRLANMAPSNNVKEQPQQQQQGQGQHQQESWKDRLANMAPSSNVREQPQQHQPGPGQQGPGQHQQGSWKDRLTNMAPSSQVRTQQPQAQGQQPQMQGQQPHVQGQQLQVQGQQPQMQGQQPQMQGQKLQMQGQQPQIQGQQPQMQGQQPQMQGQQPLQSQTGPAPQARQQQPTPLSHRPQVSQTPQAPQPQPLQAPQGTPQKGSWRSRVSGQLSSISPQNSQGKPEKPEKGGKPSTGDKLLDKLKRASKPADQPPQPPPKNGQPLSQPPHGQWRPSPVQQVPFGAPPPPQGPSGQHPFAPHNAYGQYAHQAQMRPPQNMPSGQFQQYPQQQQPQQWQGPQQPGRPAGPQQQWSYGQQMAAHHQQQTVRPPEPQYDQVPIPKGYGQVQGEYHVTQSMPQGQPMYQGQMPPQQQQQQQQQQHYQGQISPQQQQQMQQQGYYQGGQVSPPPQQQQQGQPGPASSVPQGMQQGQQFAAGRESPASPPEQGGFNLPIQGNITPGDTNPPQLPAQGAQQQLPNPQQQQQYNLQQQYGLQRPPAIRGDTIASDTGRSMESGVMGGMGQRVLPPGQPQHGHHLQPQPSTTSMNGQVQGQDLSSSASQASLNAAAAQGKPSDVPQAPSVSPDVVVEDPKTNNLAIDVEKSNQSVEDNIYDATPRLKQETTGVSDQSSSSNKQPTPDPKTVPPIDTSTSSPPMELEDTNDARMRTLRIGSQEEKIFYDPEGDVPKMSATSYPGQEWNPYGEPEFADWKDDDGPAR